MGARERLNAHHLTSILTTSFFVGIVMQSWTAFFVAIGLQLGISMHSGDVRILPKRGNRGHRQKRPPRRR